MTENAIAFLALKSSPDDVLSAVSDLAPVVLERLEGAPLRLYAPRASLTVVELDLGAVYEGESLPPDFPAGDLPMLAGAVARALEVPGWSVFARPGRRLDAVVAAFDHHGDESWRSEGGAAALQRLAKEVGVTLMAPPYERLARSLGPARSASVGDGAQVKVMGGPMTLIIPNEDGTLDESLRDLVMSTQTPAALSDVADRIPINEDGSIDEEYRELVEAAGRTDLLARLRKPGPAKPAQRKKTRAAAPRRRPGKSKKPAGGKGRAGAVSRGARKKSPRSTKPKAPRSKRTKR